MYSQNLALKLTEILELLNNLLDLAQDHHEAAGDQGLRHLDQVSQGGGAQTQAGAGHQGAIGVTSSQEQCLLVK